MVYVVDGEWVGHRIDASWMDPVYNARFFGRYFAWYSATQSPDYA